MYRVFMYVDARQRRLTRIDTKRLSRWDAMRVPAVWETNAAAHMWAKRQGFRHGYAVVKQ